MSGLLVYATEWTDEISGCIYLAARLLPEVMVATEGGQLKRHGQPVSDSMALLFRIHINRIQCQLEIETIEM